MTKPVINEGSEKNSGAPVFQAPKADVLKVATTFVMEGPEKAANCGVEKSKEIMERLGSGVYDAVQMSKPRARQVVDSFFDTTLGTIVEVSALGLGAFAGGYILTGIVRTRSEQKRLKAEAAAEAADAELI